jgi:hypothetical protein
MSIKMNLDRLSKILSAPRGSSLLALYSHPAKVTGYRVSSVD